MQDYDDEILAKAKELELMGSKEDNPEVVSNNEDDSSKNQTIDKDLLKKIKGTC